MYERHLAKLYERGISSKPSHHMHNEFPPIVINNLNQELDQSRGTKNSELRHDGTPKKLSRLINLATE